jgi:hypothetical protein
LAGVSVQSSAHNAFGRWLRCLHDLVVACAAHWILGFPWAVGFVRGAIVSAPDVVGSIWANGYGYSFDWLKLPITDPNGAAVQQRGVTARPGVYFLGLHWMQTFRSAILSFVGRDASYLADHMDGLKR